MFTTYVTVRGMLGFLICMTLIGYKNRLNKIYGAKTANWFLLVSNCYCYYCVTI